MATDRNVSGRVLVAQPKPHLHSFPFAADDAVENDVVTCGGCGQLFVARVGSDVYTHWLPLRWYHLRARRLLAAVPRDA